MARYIDADKFIKQFERALEHQQKYGLYNHAKLTEYVIKAIENEPTADVVPKSEVAREIFEEIERFLYLHFRFCKEEIGNDDTEYLKGRLELNTQIQNFIAELKKKYTEQKND